MPINASHQAIPAGQLIGEVANGKVVNLEIQEKMQRLSSHWLASIEGVGALFESLKIETTFVILAIISLGVLVDITHNHGLPEIDRAHLVFLANRVLDDVMDVANVKVLETLAQARQKVGKRLGLYSGIEFSNLQLGGRNMPSTNSIPVHNGQVGQHLTNNDVPICPITLRPIPIALRAISIQCSDTGKPSATVYDRDAIFEWLKSNQTDPVTRKVIKCLVDAYGSIIYPVRIESEQIVASNSHANSASMVHRIFSSGTPPMSKKEIEEKKAYEKMMYNRMSKRENLR